MQRFPVNNLQIKILQYLIRTPEGATIQKIARGIGEKTINVARAMNCAPMDPGYCFTDENERYYTNCNSGELDLILHPKPSNKTNSIKPDSHSINITQTRSTQKLDTDAQKAFNRIIEGESIFITGKAGTGKTFLLKQLVSTFQGEKLLAVLAPTGVAAENAGGYTMHSFLRLPLTPYFPEYKKNDLYQVDYNTEQVLKQLEIIVIDEISMVRCDMLDAADNILRHYRKNDLPFGGVQLIMFGDLFQLMPVAKEEDWEKLKEHYSSPYFFSSKVLEHLDYRVMELTHNHRQETDKPFINLLNHIREANITKKDIEFLNTRYIPHCKSSDEVVRLMTHNYKAKNYNKEKLASLHGESFSNKALYNNWYEKPPADLYLELKQGARVMFIRNDSNGQYVNGSLGWVQGFGEDYIIVKRDNNQIIKVHKSTWERYEYDVDKKTKTITSYVAGEFTQYPLKLAWAVTIHKSQGLTFDAVVIDAEKAFTYGQIYVALSRCRTFDGVLLLSHIYSQTIVTDDKVRAYMNSIDSDGKVLPLPDNIEEYEDGPLSIWVSVKKLYKIKNGNLKLFTRKIDENLQWRFFKHDDNGELVVNDIYKDRRRKWQYDDRNNNNFPFILCKYRTIRFWAELSNIKVTCELLSMDVRYSEEYPEGWSVQCRIGKVLKIEE